MSLQKLQIKDMTELGSILYSKRVMGHRVVDKSSKETTICKNTFKNYGSHHNDYS